MVPFGFGRSHQHSQSQPAATPASHRTKDLHSASSSSPSSSTLPKQQQQQQQSQHLRSVSNPASHTTSSAASLAHTAAQSQHTQQHHRTISVKPRPSAELATVLVGQRQQRFKVNKKLLCAASPFFRDRLDDPSQHKTISLWLPGEDPDMFALFVEWLHARERFRPYLEETISIAHDEGDDAAQDIHWAVIRLHLFASSLGLHHLQDLAMDALQDLYLRCDWDVPPGFIEYLYSKCEAIPAVRLRRWAVAMVAFSLTGGAHLKFHPQGCETSDPSRFQELLETYPEFAMDYSVHLRKMKSSGLDVRFKNPQLRIPANRLRNEERAFGFRECSFHSHRALVGEKRCPHSIIRAQKSIGAKMVPLPGAIRTASERKGAAAVTSAMPTPTTTTALSPPESRAREKSQDPMPRPLFSRAGKSAEEEQADDRQRAVKHIRAKSSVAT